MKASTIAATGSTIPPQAVLLAGAFLSGSGGCRSPIEDLAERLRDSGVRLVCASTCKNGLLRALDLISTAVLRNRQYGIAVIDLYSGRAFLWGEALTLVLRTLGRPFVLVLHGGNLPEFSRSRARRVTACLSRAAAVAAPSRFLLTNMQPYRSGIALIPNPLDLAQYTFRPRRKVQPSLVWIRAFHSIYNPALAPEVVALLRGEFPEVKLTMVGRDKQDGSIEETRARAEQLGVTGQITFVGGVPRHEIPNWLDGHDIFLNTTNVDNTPVSIMEAMASGLCIVSTDAGGIPALVDNGINGLIVPRNDAKSMAGAVRRILKNPALSYGLSSAARSKAEQFDWSLVLPQWLGLLNNLTTAQEANR